jgi:mono/diheme cytochrome c family protein
MIEQPNVEKRQTMARLFLSFVGLLLLSPSLAEESLQAHMREHFVAATLMQTAVINADLEDLRNQAQWLIQHPTPPNMPTGYSVFLQNLRANAKAATTAESLADAALAVAKTAASCGACHAQGSIQTWLDTELPPPAGDSDTQLMDRHQWAADRLWEGLIAPSDQAWVNGAEALIGTPIKLADHHDKEQTRALVAQVSQLAISAQAAARTTDRVRVYGEFLATCGACHQLLREP